MSVDRCAVFSCFLPCTCCSSTLTLNRNERITDNEQVGCHLPSSPPIQCALNILQGTLGTLQASNRGKLWGEAYKYEEKPCCVHTETYPSEEQRARGPYICCNLTCLADDHRLALFSFCCLQMKVGCSSNLRQRGQSVANHMPKPLPVKPLHCFQLLLFSSSPVVFGGTYS